MERQEEYLARKRPPWARWVLAAALVAWEVWAASGPADTILGRAIAGGIAAAGVVWAMGGQTYK